MTAPIWLLGPDPSNQCCGCEVRLNPCDPCTGVAPGCPCALPIPQGIGLTSYASYANAQTAISTFTSNCIGFIALQSASYLSSFSATTPSANTVVLNGATTSWVVDGPRHFANIDMWTSVNLRGGTNLVVGYTYTDPGVASDVNSITIDIWSCNLVLVNTHTILSPVSGGSYAMAIASSAQYIVTITYGSYRESTAAVVVSAVITLSSSHLRVNPVTATWSDGATLRKLNACPKMLIPLLTESNGSWYATLADAQNAITVHGSNCIGYFVGDTFSAIDGGSTVTLNVKGTVLNPIPGTASVQGSCSVNLVAGSTFTVNYSMTETVVGGGGAFLPGSISVTVYDYDGNIVWSDSVSPSGSASGTFVWSSVTYTGRYIVIVRAQSQFIAVPVTSITVDSSFQLTSSGALSANPIQALYDDGDACPARYDCV